MTNRAHWLIGAVIGATFGLIGMWLLATAALVAITTLAGVR